MQRVRAHFSPELLNRIDEGVWVLPYETNFHWVHICACREVIVFNRLQREDMAAIVDVQLRGVEQLLKEKDFTLVTSYFFLFIFDMVQYLCISDCRIDWMSLLPPMHGLSMKDFTHSMVLAP